MPYLVPLGEILDQAGILEITFIWMPGYLCMLPRQLMTIHVKRNLNNWSSKLHIMLCGSIGLRLILQIFRSFKAEATFEVFYRYEGSYIELCACKINFFVENGAFKSLNESISIGNSSRKAGPAGYTWVSYVIDATYMPTSRMA